MKNGLFHSNSELTLNIDIRRKKDNTAKWELTFNVLHFLAKNYKAKI